MALKVTMHREIEGRLTCPGKHLARALECSYPEVNEHSLEGMLAQAASQSIHIVLSPHSRMHKRILADGFLPTMTETVVLILGISYMVQQAQDPDTGETRIYYTPCSDAKHIHCIEPAERTR